MPTQDDTLYEVFIRYTINEVSHSQTSRVKSKNEVYALLTVWGICTRKAMIDTPGSYTIKMEDHNVVAVADAVIDSNEDECSIGTYTRYANGEIQLRTRVVSMALVPNQDGSVSLDIETPQESISIGIDPAKAKELSDMFDGE